MATEGDVNLSVSGTVCGVSHLCAQMLAIAGLPNLGAEMPLAGQQRASACRRVWDPDIK